MKKLEFSISKSIINVFPDIHVHTLHSYISDQSTLIPRVMELERDIESARKAIEFVEPITNISEIAYWREAYSNMGIKPSKFPSSIEALLRRTKKGNFPKTNIPAVDLYNSISVILRAPIGAYDVKKLSNHPITLRHANPKIDYFHPLGSTRDAFPLNTNLVVYAQLSEILCWGFNVRDSQKYCVDANSSEILFFSETTNPIENAKAFTALERIAIEIGFNSSKIISYSTISAHGAI